MDDLMRRAMGAWFRSGGVEKPSAHLSSVEEHQELPWPWVRKYIVLRNINGILAVWRVRPNNTLKRLITPPKEIE